MYLIVATKVTPATYGPGDPPPLLTEEIITKYSVWHRHPSGMYALGCHPNCCAVRFKHGYEAEEVMWTIDNAEFVLLPGYDDMRKPAKGYTFEVIHEAETEDFGLDADQ